MNRRNNPYQNKQKIDPRELQEIFRKRRISDRRLREQLAFKAEIDPQGFRKMIEAFPEVQETEFPEPLPDECRQGDTNVGFTPAGQPFHIPFISEDRTSMYHTSIFGLSGTGKTTLIYILALQAAQQGIYLVIIDVKRGFLRLIRHIKDLHVFTISSISSSIPVFPCNLLEPDPATDPRVHALLFTTSFCAATDLQHAGQMYLHQRIEELYALRNVYTSLNNVPTLADLTDYCGSKPPHYREPNYNQYIRILERLNTIQTLMADAAYIQHGLTASHLASMSYVLMIDSALEGFRNFYTTLLGLTQIELRKRFREFCHPCSIVIDECRDLLPDDRYNKQSPYTPVITRGREFMMSVIAADQQITKVSGTLVGNSHHLFFSTMANSEDQLKALKCAGINDHAQAARTCNLDIGEFVLKRSLPTPLTTLLRIPYIGLSQDVTDEEVEQHTEFLMERLRKNVNIQNARPVRASVQTKRYASDVLLETVGDIYIKEDWLSLRRESLLAKTRMKSDPFDRAKEFLMAKDFIRTDQIMMKSRGHASVFLELTQRGAAHLRKSGKQVYEAKPGVLHRAVCHAVAELFRADGAHVQQEYVMGNQRADLRVIKPTGRNRYAYVVEICLSNTKEDIKNTAIGYLVGCRVLENHTSLIFICRDKKTADMLRSHVTPDFRRAAQKAGISLNANSLIFEPAWERLEKWLALSNRETKK